MESCSIYLPKMSVIFLVITVSQLQGLEQRVFPRSTNPYHKTTPPVIPVPYNAPPPYTDYGLNFQGDQMMSPKISNYGRQQSRAKPQENVQTYHIKIQTDPSSRPNIPNRYEYQERHPSVSVSQPLQQGPPQGPNSGINVIPIVLGNSINRQPQPIQQVNLEDYQDRGMHREQQHYNVVNESPQPIILEQPNVYQPHREAQKHAQHYHFDGKPDYTKPNYPQGYEVYDNASPKEITINLPAYGGASQDYTHSHGEQENLEQYQVVNEGPAAHVVSVPPSGGITSVAYPVQGYQNGAPYYPAGGDDVVEYVNSGSRQPYRQAQNEVYNSYEPSYIQSSHKPDAQYEYTVRRP